MVANSESTALIAVAASDTGVAQMSSTPPASSLQPAATRATTSAPQLSDQMPPKRSGRPQLQQSTTKGRSKPSAAAEGNITNISTTSTASSAEPGVAEAFAHRTHVLKPTTANLPLGHSLPLCAQRSTVHSRKAIVSIVPTEVDTDTVLRH